VKGLHREKTTLRTHWKPKISNGRGGGGATRSGGEKKGTGLAQKERETRYIVEVAVHEHHDPSEKNKGKFVTERR